MSEQAPHPELLAPAGDWDALRAAVANGADAVYFGLEHFNARFRAENFKLDELPQIMQFLHDHNVKGYLTFNTLIFSDELPEAVEYIRTIAAAGVDAVIVQDLGLARLIHMMAPSLRIHGSTQMTLTEPRGIGFVRKLGVQRVVLARELSMPEIERIAGGSSMPLEVFVHGALCVAYSGQCLTSESIGGRSANRGQCAQACRLPYDLIVDGQMKDLGEKAYLLSPQDLAAYDLIGKLTDLGVSAFKIEGRLKAAHYVAATTQSYRAAINARAQNQPFRISDQQKGDLEQTFSRGLSHGFLDGVNHQALVTARFPKSRGRRVGTVQAVNRKSIVVSLDAKRVDLKPGDGIVFDEGHPEQDEQGGRVFVVRPCGRNQIEIELGHGDVNLHAIAIGSIVWKTDDPQLRRRLEHSFSRDTVVNRVPLLAELIARVGEPLRLTLRAEGAEASMTWDKPLEAALKHPFSEESAREQIGRLGDTPYELKSLAVETTGNPMVPKSVLNDLRRQCAEQLIEARRARVVHFIARTDALDDLRRLSVLATPDSDIRLNVLVRTLEQLQAVVQWDSPLRPTMVYCDFEDVRRYKLAVETARSANLPVALATLRVVKPHEEGTLRQILDCGPDAVLVRNLGAISFYREAAPHLPQIGDYSLNVSNELTAQIFREAGLVRMVPSYDLNWPQLSAMVRRFDPGAFEMVIHQHMPMFHMEHCVFAHTLSNGKDYRDCGRVCELHQVNLRDRVGLEHPLIPDVGCRNTVYNGQAQSAMQYIPRMRELGISAYRVELLRQRPDEVAALLNSYVDVLLGRAEPGRTMNSLAVVGQLGVTAGTLDRE